MSNPENLSGRNSERSRFRTFLNGLSDRFSIRARVKETEITQPLLRDLIISARLSTNRSIPDRIEAISLGTLADEASDLIMSTLGDPEKREFGKAVYVTYDSKVLVDKSLQVGTQQQVALRISELLYVDSEYLPRHLRAKRTFAGDIHSHPIDTPFSPIDLGDLFIVDSSRYSKIFCFVSTETRNLIVFRGKNTPQLSEDEVLRRRVSWESMLASRIGEHLSILMSEDEVVDLNNKAQMALLRDIARKYDLKVFVGQKGNQTAHQACFS